MSSKTQGLRLQICALRSITFFCLSVLKDGLIPHYSHVSSPESSSLIFMSSPEASEFPLFGTLKWLAPTFSAFLFFFGPLLSRSFACDHLIMNSYTG